MLKVSMPFLAFLDRMTVTFVVLMVVAVILSVREPFFYKTDNADHGVSERSSSVFNIGALLIISMIAVFYIVFW